MTGDVAEMREIDAEHRQDAVVFALDVGIAGLAGETNVTDLRIVRGTS